MGESVCVSDLALIVFGSCTRMKGGGGYMYQKGACLHLSVPYLLRINNRISENNLYSFKTLNYNCISLHALLF